MKIFDNLLNIMDDINEIYIKMFKLESLRETDGNYFKTLISDLKTLLSLEQEEFEKFVNSYEYLVVKDWISKDGSTVAARLREYVSLSDGKNDKDDIGAKKIKKLYETCLQDVFLIYLSFVQEYIDTMDDVASREKMISLKYYNCFKNLDMQNLLIQYNFCVPKENYVSSYLVADFVKVEDVDNSEILLDAKFSVLMDLIQQLFKVRDVQYNDPNVSVAAKNIEFMIMACFSMINEDDYECIRDNIFDTINSCSNTENDKASDIMDVILDSRNSYKSRVRKISLNPNID